MAKTLRDSTPTSSVARLLDREAANRAIQSNAPATTWPSQANGPGAVQDTSRCINGDVPRIKREFILTQEAEDTFCEILALFRRNTRCRLTASQLFRAMLKAAGWSLPSLNYEAHQLGPQRMPGNGRNAHAQREAFEQRLAAAIAAGIRPVATRPKVLHSLGSEVGRHYAERIANVWHFASRLATLHVITLGELDVSENQLVHYEVLTLGDALRFKRKPPVVFQPFRDHGLVTSFAFWRAVRPEIQVTAAEPNHGEAGGLVEAILWDTDLGTDGHGQAP